MHDVKNSPKYVIVFSIRDIDAQNTPFTGIKPTKCLPLIEYLSGLNDDCAEALHVSVSSVQSNPEEQNAVDELKTELCRDLSRLTNLDDLIDSIKEAKSMLDLEAVKEEYNTGDSQQKVLEILEKIPDSQDSQPSETMTETMNVECLWNELMTTSVTHCDKQGALWKHRLGWYVKEEEEYAVCAVYPWMGEGAADHNEKWRSLLVNAVTDKFKDVGVKRIILVCHDKDFMGLDGRDGVVSIDINENGYYADQGVSIPLVVFMHTNQLITSAFGGDKSVKDIYNCINDYVSGYARLKKANEDSLNAEAHKEVK